MLSFNWGRSRRRGFTLVELLVVIGIIALLISILLPSLSRAREQGKAIKCLSNMRQLGTAFVQYFNNNKGSFPFAAGNLVPNNEDWIWWQKTVQAPGVYGGVPYFGRPVPDPAQSAIAPYIGQFNPEYFICPSDDVTSHKTGGAGGGYFYSYAMNCLMDARLKTTPKVTGIRESTEKVMLVEEDDQTIDDGYWSPPTYDTAGNVVRGGGNLLAVRHDRRKHQPDSTTTPLPNADLRGNVLFVDGHAEFASREFVHLDYHVNPTSR
jgi:prepilin-type N-terminal cleavage/methylation domain-containing protein/prepilin-type processing-associated H-X9-DG protein